jgi:PHD/YefM family antitoxin component YafN of YafNO toxin-antitoxin module
MRRKQPYDISYDEAIREHLRAIEAKYHPLIRAKIEEQLAFEPARETRNRKPLRQPAPFEATWELRFGPDSRFRVLYGIDEQGRQVQISGRRRERRQPTTRRWRGGRAMKVATQDEVAAHFFEYLKATKKGPVVVTSKGKPVAVLLRSENEEDVERLLMGHSPKLQSILEAARKRFREGCGIPHEAFWQEVEAANAITKPKRRRAGKNSRTKG